jgi:hypothetical protein
MAQEMKQVEALKASEGWTPARLSELAYQAAGACSAVFLQKHPEDVMPTQEISESVERILVDFGIDTAAPDA